VLITRRSRAGVPVPALLLVLIVAMLSTAVSSASAAGWLEPKDISAANEEVDGRPKVAVDPAGNAVAIWERHVGGEEIVEAAERPAGGDWSEPDVLSLPGEEGQGSQVAIDAAGNAIAVWITGDGSPDFVVRSAVRPPGGTWSKPKDVSDSISAAGSPMLAIDGASEVVAVWTAFDGGHIIAQGSVRSASGAWSEPDDLSPAGQDVTPLEAPDVAIDAAGNAIAVWKLEGSDDIVQAAVRPAGQEDWVEPDDLSDAGQNAREPAVAMNEAGEAVAIWTRSDGSDDIVQAAVRPAAGDWAGADDLSAPGQDAGQPAVAIDETGGAVAVWHRFNGSDFIVQGSVRPPDGDWAGAEDLSATGQDGLDPIVVTNDAVGAVAAWFRSDGANLRVQATARPVGGEWSKAHNLSVAGERAGFPDLALDAAGDAFAVFGRDGDDGPFVQATGYDFVAPRLERLRIPATGTVGERVSFAVSPFDVFPLAGTSWTFGDGSQAAGGNSVSHVYAAPGAYPVTVSAVDAGGNASTQVATIAISAKPPPPPPRRKFALTLRIERESLQKLIRTGTLRVAASVNEAASLTLSGRAKFKLRRARGRARTRLVPVFLPKTVSFDAAAEEKVTLALSERGRKALRSLSKVRILIAGEARNDDGRTAKKKAAKTLR